jgi:hypothetical protein
MANHLVNANFLVWLTLHNQHLTKKKVFFGFIPCTIKNKGTMVISVYSDLLV